MGLSLTVVFICLFLEFLESVPFLFIMCNGGARGVMVIVVGNGHGDTRSNPGRDRLYFT